MARNLCLLLKNGYDYKGYESIHTESSPVALKFYQAINYMEIPFNDPDGYEGSLNDIAMGKLL